MVREITLNHICKIEGHASLDLKIEKNKVIKCELKASEGARFFEGLVIGKKLQDVQEIVSRICGICSSAHTVASVQALEDALKIKPSKQQQIIRELLMLGERIRSNATHLYFLTLPDYYNLSSALELAKIEKHKSKIGDALKLITIGNKIIENIGGREIHPFLHIKEYVKHLENYDLILNHLEDSIKTAQKTADLFLSLKYPKLNRKTDYLSLSDSEYAVISGKIKSHLKKINIDDYKKHISENIKEYATSKFGLFEKHPYAVGSIARINNNHEKLDNLSKKYIKKLKLPLNSPYENNMAQAIEIIQAINRAIKLIKDLEKLTPEKNLDFKIKAGHGVSAVEAPRGTLFHEYKINNQGIIEYCNIITPTVQNLNQMEIDITTLVDNLLEKQTNKDKIILEIEKLIRSYDPCFSCSTHFLKVKWE